MTQDTFQFLPTDFLKNEEIFLKLVRTGDADPEKQWLPAYYFRVCLSGGTDIGFCDLRIGHNRNTYYGGNIGYGIDEPYRGHHYAGKACKLLFGLAKMHGMEHLIITCRPDNIPSAKTCVWAGGVYQTTENLPEDNDMYKEGMRQVSIYKFTL